jgi:DNA-binding transcriptional ArsR family regulator
MTKVVAVALDIAGRPDTDDAYALNSVRKAYSLLNGATFQDFIEEPRSTPSAQHFGIDWMEAYRLEAAKAEALAERLRDLEAEAAHGTGTAGSRSEELSKPSRAVQSDKYEPTGRAERMRGRIVSLLRDGDHTAQELSRITRAHVRTIQRRLRELATDGLVAQAADGLSPLYTLAKERMH